MTWTGAADGAFLVLALGLVLLKCVEPAPTRPQFPGAQKLMMPTLGVLGLSLAMRPGPALERFGLLVSLLLMSLALVIEHLRAVRLERLNSAATPPRGTHGV
ncbi:hypothetical protein [Kineosporia sp. R_H_3]|uniref:hypothetical protein n=1 Tax=Kineosporia sp. R_H_3 TaxID=1961848 RepID=UPI000B4AC5D7|nr:hypothetical protein [Kineosporia sp. R_H_3]